MCSALHSCRSLWSPSLSWLEPLVSSLEAARAAFAPSHSNPPSVDPRKYSVPMGGLMAVTHTAPPEGTVEITFLCVPSYCWRGPSRTPKSMRSMLKHSGPVCTPTTNGTGRTPGKAQSRLGHCARRHSAGRVRERGVGWPDPRLDSGHQGRWQRTQQGDRHGNDRDRPCRMPEGRLRVAPR